MKEVTSSEPYVVIIERFLDEKIDGEAFERQFTDLFLDEPSGMPVTLHEVLSALHLEIEAFVADSDLLNALRERHPNHHHIDELQLRAAAVTVLSRLRKS